MTLPIGLKNQKLFFQKIKNSKKKKKKKCQKVAKWQAQFPIHGPLILAMINIYWAWDGLFIATNNVLLQVHISSVGEDKMRISWITESSTPATVEYGTSPGVYGSSVSGSTSSYKYMLYKSGEIHDVVIGPLTPNTLYYYRCGSNSAREFSFKTPPAQLPIEFAVVGM